MNPSLETPPLFYYFKKSFSIHFVLVLAGLIFSFFSRYSLRKERKERAKLIQASVKVDVVAMPKMTFQELKALEKYSKAELKAKERKETLDFQKMIRKISKKKIHKKTVRIGRRKKLSVKARKRLRRLILAGNKISIGSGLTGSLSSSAKRDFEIYASSLPNHIRPHWKLPSFLKEMDLRCRIKIFLNSQGVLVKTEMLEGSGDDEYDKRAMEAISATTFPLPDPSFQKELIRGGLILGFPL